MSSFTADWLALRAPADRAARDPVLLERLVAWRRTKGPITVVDLASGSGANWRELAPRLGGAQQWRLLEQDPDLLARGEGAVERRQIDLAQCDLGTVLAGADLVTASALIDLVSADWLARLARETTRLGAALYVALSYDGRVTLSPGHPDDSRIVALVNRHQRRDKGFSAPALGPAGPVVLATLLAEQGYGVASAPADWHLGPGPLLDALVNGWAEAAAEAAPDQAAAIATWHQDRRGHLERARVGHRDLLALPA